MEALRLLRESGLAPRRTVRAVLFTGEEYGLAGAAAYGREHGHEHHVAAFETDYGMAAPDAIGVGSEETVRGMAPLLPAFGQFGIRRFRPHAFGADVEPIVAHRGAGLRSGAGRPPLLRHPPHRGRHARQDPARGPAPERRRDRAARLRARGAVSAGPSDEGGVMIFAMRPALCGLVLLAAVTSLAGGVEAPFMADNKTAMAKMMAGMDVKPSGDVDADFVAMMVPHHQGAIDMAQAELRYGRNEQLRRLAQEIIVTQQEEIAAMRARDRSAPMRRAVLMALLAVTTLGTASAARAGQAPGAASDADVPVSHRDRVYAAEQFSNTVSVTDPADNRLLGVIRLGDPAPTNLQPALSRAAAGARHGLLARPPDHRGGLDRLELGDLHRHRDQRREARHLCRPLAARGILHTGREGGLGDGPRRELRLRARRQRPTRRRRASRCRTVRGCRSSRRTGSTATSARRSRRRRSSSRWRTIRSSGGCRRPARSVPTSPRRPDGTQVWFTLKDVGKVTVFDAHPPFAVLKTLDTGPITNHVNFVAQRQRHVRLRHRRRTQRGAGVPDRRLLEGRHHSRRQAAARNLAVRRRDPRLRRARERRRPHRDRHADEHGDRHRPDRPGGSGRQLRAGRGADGRRHAGIAAARRRRSGGAPHARAGGGCRRDERQAAAHERLAVRPGVAPGAAGGGHRARADSAPMSSRCRAHRTVAARSSRLRPSPPTRPARRSSTRWARSDRWCEERWTCSAAIW